MSSRPIGRHSAPGGRAAAVALSERLIPAVAVVAGAATLLALISTGQAGVWLVYQGQPTPWAGLLRANIVHWYCCAVFVPAIYWLARRFPLGRSPSATAVPLHLAASLVFALLKESLFVAVGEYFRPGVFALPEILAGDFMSEVLAFWALIGIVHAFVYYEAGKRREAPAARARPLPSASGDTHFTVRERGGYRLVAAADVEWIDAEGNYAKLHTSGGCHLVRETMAALEARLGPRFLRVHRRIIVNVDRVGRIEPLSHGTYRLVLASGAGVGSGRSYASRIRALIG